MRLSHDNKRTVSFSPILTRNYSIDDEAKSKNWSSVKTPGSFYTTKEKVPSQTSVLFLEREASIKESNSLPNQTTSFTYHFFLVG
ncbi:hypothetical protein SNEBB_003921 [Seison nebaliae]|nr:hypothetical protein SNEBB_003921 [Seison nebaliae]